MPNRPSPINFGFSLIALLDLIGRIEDKIAAYIQNINISLVEKPVQKRKSKIIEKEVNKDDKSDIEGDKTLNL